MDLEGEPHGVASVNAVVSYPSGKQSLRHLFEFRAANQSFQIAREGIENERAHEVRGDPSLYYQLLGGQAVINGAGAAPRQLSPDKINPNSRSWRSGGTRTSTPKSRTSPQPMSTSPLPEVGVWSRHRRPAAQKADVRSDRLEEDFSNLGLFLNRLRRHPKAKTPCSRS